jgi:hypothetical protein
MAFLNRRWGASKEEIRPGGPNGNSPAIYRWASKSTGFPSRRDGRSNSLLLSCHPSDESLGYNRPALRAEAEAIIFFNC